VKKALLLLDFAPSHSLSKTLKIEDRIQTIP